MWVEWPHHPKDVRIWCRRRNECFLLLLYCKLAVKPAHSTIYFLSNYVLFCEICVRLLMGNSRLCHQTNWDYYCECLAHNVCCCPVVHLSEFTSDKPHMWSLLNTISLWWHHTNVISSQITDWQQRKISKIRITGHLIEKFTVERRIHLTKGR